MTDFTKIKSKFAKEKIKGLKYSKKNAEYIEALIKIEKYKLGKLWGLQTGYMVIELKRDYPKEWDAIGEELDPNHKTLKQERKDEKMEEELLYGSINKIIKQEKEESKNSWKKMGGK